METIGTALDYIRATANSNYNDYGIWASERMAFRVQDYGYLLLVKKFMQYEGWGMNDDETPFGFAGFNEEVGTLVELQGGHSHALGHLLKELVDRSIVWSLSRIDVCNTVMMQWGQIRGWAESWAVRKGLRHSKLIDEGDGCTVYYGNRKNDKFVRVYEKKIAGEEYVRFEFELKHRKAKSYTSSFYSLPVEEFAQRCYVQEFEMMLNENSSVKVPHEIFRTFRTQSNGRIIRDKRPTPDRMAWLESQIRPLLLSDDPQINQFVTSLYNEKIVRGQDMTYHPPTPLTDVE